MSEPAAWLRVLADVVAKAIEPIGPIAPLDCHYVQVDGFWEVTLFTEATEVLGGPEDGTVKQPRFAVRICEILDAFQSVISCTWQAHNIGENDDLGPHLAVEGTYKGRLVWLRVLSQAPRQFPRRRVSPVAKMVNDDVW
ncbi:MAG: hypothetical protein V4719_21070 [Planctomycetota bacterium]